MATNDQLKSYAASLPPIYQEILAAFPRIEPTRNQGFGLAFQTLSTDFESRHIGYSLGEIIQACQALEQHHIVEIKHRIFVYPTQLGEHLIGIITGQHVLEVMVPELPSPPA